MAAGGGRLGSVLTDVPDALDVVAALTVLDEHPSPRGDELATARRLHEWAAARWPDIGWSVEPVGDDGANLVASHGAGPLLYSHLDTSLDGSPRDAAVTGSSGPVGPLRVSDTWVDGFALAVARAPAAVALVAFATAPSGSLLLASSGTHRRGSASTGVEVYLDTHALPTAAVVAKCGPRSPLWQEPGAAYLTVRVTGRSGVALAPASAQPSGGVVRHAGIVLDAVSAWRSEHLAATEPVGQVGPACGIGALTSGWPDKPDLLPASLEVGIYLVTVPGEDVAVAADRLADRVRTACAGGPLAGCTVRVDLEVVHAAAATSTDAAIVSAALDVWTEEFGAPAPVVGWAGSTDGVVLRAAGVDTVRLGPSPTPAPDDPRRDRFMLADVSTWVRVYRKLL